jgi:hypothetical protein
VLELPDQTEENYLYTLQKFFDERIKTVTGKEIWGLKPIKVALIIQAIMQRIGFELNANLQLVGSKSSGKTLILETYGSLLYGSKFKKTTSRSISIPRLQGTREKVLLFNKEIPYNSKGMLGEFYNIYIDEAGQNKELIENLKTYLQDDTYSYAKVGSTGVINKRTCHINIAGNIEEVHIGNYVGGIKKKYSEPSQIGAMQKKPWDGTVNLFLPLSKYDDLYYYSAIKYKRDEFTQKNVYWMDGYEDALHQRFLLYFNISNDKTNQNLIGVVDKNSSDEKTEKNVTTGRLYSHSIEKYFNDIRPYAEVKDDPEKFKRLSDMFDMLKIDRVDARVKIFWNRILKISRIANKRTEITEEDYKLVFWLIEATNRLLDVTDTDNYYLTPIDELIQEHEKKMAAEKIIEITKKEGNEMFGLPEGEFL